MAILCRDGQGCIAFASVLAGQPDRLFWVAVAAREGEMRYRMIVLICGLGLSALSLSALPAQAETGFKLDVRELYQDCKAAQGSPDYSYCLGVVTGVAYM